MNSDGFRTRRDMGPAVVTDLEAAGFNDADEIGRGGFGIVYRCTQVALERIVAVKVLTAELDENRDRFLREQRAMGRLTGHPNIVGVLQVGETASGYPYLVMQYHRQGSLDARIRRLGLLPMDEVLRLGVKMAGALETAHRLEILHRDVKPANILLTDFGEPALTDFGIAHVAGGFQTATGIFTGSPAFTAPEILSGDQPSRASDVYALGATLFAALTGHAAFERRSGEQVVAQFLRIASESAPDLRDRGIPDDVSAVVAEAMAHDADKRPSTLELGEELQQIQQRNGFPVDEMALRAEPDGDEPMPEIKLGDQPLRASGNLPEPVTSFVGRVSELADIKDRLAAARLVTLVGPGGVGKTRLALQVAGDVAESFSHGAWMVDLAGLRDESRLPQTVLAALAIPDQSARPPEDKLANHVRGRNMLVVLDNCEHILGASARLVASLLQVASGLRVLATSREPLGIDGEHLVTVPPLSTPDPEHPPPREQLERFEAVSLLVDRGRAVRSGFEITADNHKAVARLCAWLDGVPLAIELAANRLRSLSVSEIVERLDDRFGLLTVGSRTARPRQQTLRAAVDWSHSLCTREEQQLWARLSVFPDSFDAEAAESVCGGDGLDRERIVDVLDHLVAKSIVVAEPTAERMRYRLLVSIREYGAELLEPSVRDNLGRNHRDHYAQRARSMASTWCGPGQAEMLIRMRQDHPNLRAALEWSLAHAGEQRAAAAMAGALRYQWIAGGFLSEGRRWLDQALAVASEPSAERGEALWVAAWVYLMQGDIAGADALLDQCASVAAGLGDEALGNHAAAFSGLAAFLRGELQAAVALSDRAIAEYRRSGDMATALIILFPLVVALVYDQQCNRARAASDESMRLSDAYGERWTRAYTQWASGIIAWREGDLDAADRHARKALAETRQFEDRFCSGLTIELLAWLAVARSQHTQGAHLLGIARAVWQELGVTIANFGPHLSGDSLTAEHLAIKTLGSERFSSLVRESLDLHIDEAITLALENVQPA